MNSFLQKVQKNYEKRILNYDDSFYEINLQSQRLN